MPTATDAELQNRLNLGRQMLADAAVLAALCASHWDDEEDLHRVDGGRIHYAVDTGLNVMYAQPYREPDRRPQVFRGASDVHEQVVALLGDLVMRRLDAGVADATENRSTSAPLIALPPHDEENRRVCLAIVRDAAEQFRADAASQNYLETKLAAAVQDASGADDALARLLNVLETDAPSMAAYLRCDSPTELLRLLPRGRLVHPAFHPAFGDGPQQLRRPPPALHEGRLVALRAEADDWFKKLKSDLRAIAPDTANKLRDDAWALAYLQWVNRDAAVRKTGHRVILITTNQLILAAGREVEASHKGFKHFAAAYLRDARALLGTKHCFAPAPTPETQFRILEFLSVLFPNAVLQDHSTQLLEGVMVDVDAEEAISLVESGEIDEALNLLVVALHRAKKDGDFPAADLAKWRQVVTGTLKQIVVERRQQRNDPPWPGLADNQVDVHAFLAALVKRVQQSFADLYLSMGVIGIEQLLDANTKVRGLPALRFDENYPGAQVQAERLSALMFQRNRETEFDLEDLYTRLRVEDDSNYHAHVLHAFVYASSGKWFQARTLCRVALAVVDAIPPVERGARLGREAAYLMAVAERRLATNADKLAYARRALADARARSDPPLGPGTAEDVRFEVEAFAQDVTELQFHHFDLARKLVVDVAALVARAHALADSVDTPQETVSCIRHWVIRQAITNGLIAALVGALRGQRFTHVEGDIRRLLERISEEQLAPGLLDANPTHAYPDEVSDFIWLVAATRWGTPSLSTRARGLLEALPSPLQSNAMSKVESLRNARFLELVGLQANETNAT